MGGTRETNTGKVIALMADYNLKPSNNPDCTGFVLCYNKGVSLLTKENSIF